MRAVAGLLPEPPQERGFRLELGGVGRLAGGALILRPRGFRNRFDPRRKRAEAIRVRYGTVCAHRGRVVWAPKPTARVRLPLDLR